jgi:hypothetical protein
LQQTGQKVQHQYFILVIFALITIDTLLPVRDFCHVSIACAIEAVAAVENPRLTLSAAS